MRHSELRQWLREGDESRLAELYAKADAVRRAHVGDEVHLRGLVEISNHCVRQCLYCGIRAGRSDLPRYRMTAEEILECARAAVGFGYGTLVMQAGEDPGLSTDFIAEVIRAIKRETPLAVTLSLGVRDVEELRAWREAGADRYLIRFETSNAELYARIHPHRPGQQLDRLQLLGELRTLGYEVGSGVMVGIPGQTFDDLANDLLLFQQLDLDMIGVGPYLADPNTPLGRLAARAGDDPAQVPATAEMTRRVVAVARLLCPKANIPSTTALATIDPVAGREKGLASGANVVMPNLTPPAYRRLYAIYPDKACVGETAEKCQACLAQRIRRMGRTVGAGRGDSPNWAHRNTLTLTEPERMP